MVVRKDVEKKYALISVYDKKHINFLCKNLIKNNFLLISTGSTGSKIRKLGHKCIDISKITGFKEMLNGRVKTLNTKIYSSILFVRNNLTHKKQLRSLKVPKIDIVIVNLYPFKKFSKSSSEDKVIEMIDIGGPSLIRAAGKNYRYVTAITNTQDYSSLIKNIEKNKGETDINFRRKMAKKIFYTTSMYDKYIYDWFNAKKK